MEFVYILCVMYWKYNNILFILFIIYKSNGPLLRDFLQIERCAWNSIFHIQLVISRRKKSYNEKARLMP